MDFLLQPANFLESNSTNQEILHNVFPYLKVLKDGTVERSVGTETVPAQHDPVTGVTSKDRLILPESGVSARFYKPKDHDPIQTKKIKLPLFVYFHGGAFCVASTSFPLYHEFLNKFVAEANVIAMSVDYRLAPEFPLPAAYEDSWDALKWVAAEFSNDGNCVGDDVEHEPWIKDHVDIDKVYLAGDSAGANIAHHLSFRGSDLSFEIRGIVAIHPYFWGSEPIGVEVADAFRRGLVDKWWGFVCPSDKGSDDPLINPFAPESPSLKSMGGDRILICLAEKDILRDRGRLYYEALLKSGWKGTTEIVETKGEDHVFYIFDSNCENAKRLFKSIAAFMNKDK